MNNAYIIDISNINLDLISLENTLPNQCISIVNKYKNQDDKRNSLIAWHMLNKYLKNDYNIDLSTKKIMFNEYKKPYIEGIYFNITHSKNYIGIAISNEECGIDIEVVDNDKIYKESFIKKVLSNKEYDEYLTIKNNDFIIKNWTKKEAYFKRSSTGIIMSKLKEDLDYDSTTIELYDRLNNKYYLSISPKNFNIIKNETA